jgi:hypothetical protein
MEILIDGGPIAPETILWSELGFGQIAGAVDRYELRIPIGEFLERFEAIYDEAIEELRADDRITGDFRPPIPGATDYLSLPELVRVGGEVLAEFVIAFLKFDIFRAYFPSAREGRFALATLDQVTSDGHAVVLTGRARQLKPADAAGAFPKTV